MDIDAGARCESGDPLDQQPRVADVQHRELGTKAEAYPAEALPRARITPQRQASFHDQIQRMGTVPESRPERPLERFEPLP